MTDSTILTIIIAVAAVAVIGTGAFLLARHLRGKIRINLPVTGFDPGDIIKGSFELHAKKPIKGKRLIVTLIGTQHIRTKRGDKTETHSHEVYRKEEIIEESRDITEKKLSRQKMQESEKRFQKMLSLVLDMISIHDQDFNILYSNW